MGERRDYPVTDDEVRACNTCSRCGKQIVWKRPFHFSSTVPLDIASRVRGSTGEWRLEVHFAYCVGKKPRGKPRKRHGGHRQVGSDERSFC